MPPSLLSLPAELRRQIYTYLFSISYISISGAVGPTLNPSHNLSLSTVCKQFRRETFSFLDDAIHTAIASRPVALFGLDGEDPKAWDFLCRYGHLIKHVTVAFSGNIQPTLELLPNLEKVVLLSSRTLTVSDWRQAVGWWNSPEHYLSDAPRQVAMLKGVFARAFPVERQQQGRIQAQPPRRPRDREEEQLDKSMDRHCWQQLLNFKEESRSQLELMIESYIDVGEVGKLVRSVFLAGVIVLLMRMNSW
jgi:hypothetical protein